MVRNGNISNHVSPTIAVRVEDCLLKKKGSGELKEFVRNFNKLYSYEVNRALARAIRFLHSYSDYKIVLVVNNSVKNKQAIKDLQEEFSDFEFTFIHRDSYILNKLYSMEFANYVDDDLARVAGLRSAHGVISSQNFIDMVRTFGGGVI